MASKMYRSRSNKWFAGVCGGVANYFNIDPKFVRLVYIILAIFIPKEPKR